MPRGNGLLNQEKSLELMGYPGGVLGGAKPFVRSSTLDRDSTILVVQMEPGDRLSMTADMLYVDGADQKILRGIEIPFAWGQGAVTAGAPNADGLVTTALLTVSALLSVTTTKSELLSCLSTGFNAMFDYA